MIEGFESVQTWLSNTFNIKVSEAWLGACLEWIHQENQGPGIPAQQLQAMVFDQWLVSDLTEIGQGCLPAEVATETKMELVSNYPLQVNSCVDAGFPLYGQLQKMQGKDNPNEHVTGDRPFTPAWEPKASQLLVLEMTDGHTNVRGLEVERVQGLHPGLPSGTKVLVSGPLVCRRGMMLLMEGQVQVLGGEVDTLSEANTPLTNLQAAMARNRETAGGDNMRKEFSGNFITRGDKKKMMQEQYSSQKWEKKGNSSFASTSQTHTSRVGGSSFTAKPEFKPKLSQKPTSTSFGKGQNQFPIKHVKVQQVDDWEDDLDYAELFDDEMEASTSASAPPPPPMGNRNSSDTFRNKLHKSMARNNINSNSMSSTSTTRVAPMVTEDMDMFDDDMDLIEAELSLTENVEQHHGDQTTSSNLPWLKNKNPSKRLKTETTKRVDEDVSFNYSRSPPPPSTTSASSLKSRNLSRPIKTESFGIKREMQPLSFKGELNSSSSSCSPVIPIMSNNSKNVSQMQVTSNQIGQSKTKKSQKQSKLSDMFSMSSRPKVSSIIKEEVAASSIFHTDIKQEGMSPSVKQEALLSPKAQSSTGSSPLTPVPAFLKTSPGSNTRTTPRAVVMPFCGGGSTYPANRSAERSANRSANVSMSSNVSMSAGRPDVPFRYLSEINSCPGDQLVVVKAYISTLTTKLNTNNGERWALACRINDGTDTIEVDLHNNILTELIGFSAPESVIMKQRIRTEPEIKDMLQEGLSGCQLKLANTSCLMELEAPLEGQGQGHSDRKWVIVRFVSLTSSHVAQLRDRQR